MANSFRTDIRDAAAQMHYELSSPEELGVSLTYSSKGGTDNVIYGIPSDVNGNTVDLLSLQVAESRVTFSIAKQTGSTADWPPAAGIQMGDKISWAYDGTTAIPFQVELAANPDGLGAVYEIQAVNLVAQKAGG